MGDNVTSVRQVYDAFARGDVPTVLDAMDPRIDWQEPEGIAPVLTSQVGPDAVLQNVLAKMSTVFSTFTIDVKELLDAGDVVVALGVYRAVGHDTGQPLTADFSHVWRFGEDGKVVGFRTYTDTHLWRESLGLDQRSAASSGARAQ
jgi:ketosteroid isomerase-like protein